MWGLGSRWKHYFGKRQVQEYGLGRFEAMLIQLEKDRSSQIETLIQRVDAVARAVGAPLRAEIHQYMYEHQIGLLETLRLVRREKLSLARLGDGEIRAMFRLGRAATFQDGSGELERRMKAVLRMDGYDHRRLLVALPGPLFTNSFWEARWPEFWIAMRPFLPPNSKFGDSFVSRTQFFAHFGEEAVAAWKDIWDGQDVWLVTGQGSRFERIDELFSEVRSMNVIYSKPTEAFDDLGRVIEEIKVKVPQGSLCLISLGPAGTVLAADLSNLGYWALDIGHISASYDEWIGRGPKPEKMPLIG